ncbi:PLPL1 protein, partial [Rhinopomastus cyanomelas]|nr:PLPL1 protein [Rhinopomastus cyanomelas]
PYSLMFRGCSSLIIYEAAVWAALKDYSPDLLKSASRVYGASAGSVVAAFGLCGCDIGKGFALPFFLCEAIQSFLCTMTPTFFGLLPGGDTINILKCLLNKHLPPNAHQLVSGKLHVIVTRVRDCRSVTISEFASKEDLMQAIVCSCYIPLYFGFLPPLYHGVRYVDGEIGMWRSNLVSRTTITVSAFAGEFDICPKDGPAGFFTLQLSDCIFQISKKNMSRFLNVI